MISLQSGHGKKEFFMKNTLKFLGIIAITAIVVFAMTGCPNGTTEFTITFDSQGGSTIPSITGISSGTAISKPAPDPTRLDHTFGGWFKEAVCTTEWNFETDLVTGDTTLYAKWTEISQGPYTVTFNSQEGNSVDSITNVSSGTKITKPAPDPIRSGYSFGGWYKEETCTTVWNFETDTVTSNTTLFAKWYEIISMEDGTIWTLRAYNGIDLRARRSSGDINSENYEESYSSSYVRYDEIYNGTIDDLKQNLNVDGTYKLRISGTVNEACNNMKIFFQYVPNNGENWIHLGSTSDENMVIIGPGDFSEVIEFVIDDINMDSLPEGYIIIFLMNQLINKHGDYIYDSNERIPDEMPNDTIWATINNLVIEPVGQ